MRSSAPRPRATASFSAVLAAAITRAPIALPISTAVSPTPPAAPSTSSVSPGLGLVELDGEIAGLVDRSTRELRGAWRTLHHTGPPLGLSRDLIIRWLADKLQQRAHGGPS